MIVRRRNSEDNLDLVTVNLDPADQAVDDVTTAAPIESIKALADLGCKVLETTDDQHQFPLGFGGLNGRAPLLLQPGQSGSQAGNARLKFRTLDYAFGVAIDQPTDPAS